MMNAAVKTLETDYLVVGAGAMGMAFTDALITESQASVIIVDRHDQPGGHWNDAYSFVRLHGSSAYYGVNSTALGKDTIDQTGLNSGFHEQASAAEICSYFDEVMRNRLIASGRVRYFPKHEYRNDGTGGKANIFSLVSGEQYRIVVRKKIVDATFTDTAVPSRNPPKYAVAPGVQCVPPNALPNLSAHGGQYVVVGAGKTGIDVCLWLLQQKVSAERITWIMPRDSWLIDRSHVQPRALFFANRMQALVKQFELIARAESPEHLLRLLNEHGQLLRIDEQVTPRRFRCATVSQLELKELRRITNVVRLGSVQRIEKDRIVLGKASIAANDNTIYVDCTTSGIRSRGTVKVFDRDTITLQPIRTCQQSFSSALIAHIETNYLSDEEKNAFCNPIPLPIRDIDWLTMFLVNLENQTLWSRTPDLRNWIANSRLDPNYGRTQSLTDAEGALVSRFKEGAAPTVTKLRSLLTTL